MRPAEEDGEAGLEEGLGGGVLVELGGEQVEALLTTELLLLLDSCTVEEHVQQL